MDKRGKNKEVNKHGTSKEDANKQGSSKKDENKQGSSKEEASKQGPNKRNMEKREQRERGFEALLKPIQDIIAKDWKVRLCNILDVYLQHVHNSGNILINFSEAAILLQNTSTYYSKRVDLMYNWVRQFAIGLTSSLEDNSGENTDGSHPQRKTSQRKRLLQTDTLQCLDYSISDHKKTLIWDKIGEKPVRKIILRMTMKAPSKEGTNCTVFQSNNEEMGYKEEFRLHWRISNQGPLHEDFYNSTSTSLISAGMDGEDDMSEVDMTDDFIRDDVADRSMVLDEVAPMNIDHDPYLELDQSRHSGNLDQSSVTNNAPESVEEARGGLPEDPFCKVIPFAVLIIHRKFKKARCSKRGLASEKGKSKKTKNSEETVINYHLSFSQILGGKAEDMITFRLRKRKDGRLKLHQEKRADVNANIRTAHNDNDDHHDMTDNDDEDYEERLADLENSFGEGRNDAVSSPDFQKDSLKRLALLHDFFTAKSNEQEISKAVGTWHAKVEEAIADSEKNSIFDVHAYGSKVIEKFGGLGETKSFTDIVVGQSRKEISRYLLSSLMLANTYNVELSKTDPNELSKDCLMLKLISTVRHHEELDANVGATAAKAL